jgi:UDP-N-acetylmuramate dehydrogenase
MLPEAITAAALRGEYGHATLGKALADLSKWRIGGPCALVVEPASADQVRRFLHHADETQARFIVVGSGSNLLFSDEGFAGACLRIGERLSGIEIDGPMVTADAGAWVPRLARLAGRNGLTGFEHLVGVPGSVGGLITMNGGSQRRTVSEQLVSVESVGRAGDIVVRERDECQFGYRSSIFRSANEVILSARFSLPPRDKTAIRQEMLATLRNRRRKFPLKLPNCGSVFVSNPALHAAVGPPGMAIEQAGLKGLAIGGAQVSERHANFFVNTGGATSRDMRQLIHQVQQVVLRSTGFLMRTEVLFVNSEGDVIPADEAGTD